MPPSDRRKASPLAPSAAAGASTAADWSAAAQRGRESIKAETARHRERVASGIGAYFGDHSAYARSHPTDDPAGPTRTSCIDWAMQHLEKVHVAAGESARWERIKATVLSEGAKGGKEGKLGTVLARELAKEGWTVLFFDPDTKEVQSEPLRDRSGHSLRDAQGRVRMGDEAQSSLNDVNTKGRYYDVPVDGKILDYNRTPGAGRQDNLAAIEKLRQAPFFYGVAKGGTHTFVGYDGTISEVHWKAEPNDPNVIGEVRFEDKDADGERLFGWRSGLVLVPPGTWAK